MLHRAMKLGQSGELAAADRLLATVLELDPAEPDALQLKGMIARRRGANEDAIRYFAASLRVHPDQPHVLNNLGNSLQALGRGREAAATYRKALRLAPDYHEARVNLGLALVDLDGAQEAHALLSAAAQARPGDPKAWAALGRALRSLRRCEEAIMAFRRSLELRPDHIPTTLALAVVLRVSNQPAEALKLLAHAPGSPEIDQLRGHCHQDLGEFAKAAAAYARAIAIRPEDRALHDALCRLQWQMGDDEAYLTSYAEALRVRPDDPGLLADLANRLTLGGRSNESVDLLSAVMSRRPDSAELRFRLAQALWAQGRSAEAMEEFAAARNIAPEDASIARDMARAFIILGQYGHALELVDAVLAENPTDQQAIAYRASALRLLGDEAGARWINDEERFVSSTMLIPPADEGSIERFNGRLEKVLADLHMMMRHPLEQTLRGGTQTMDDLLDRPIAEIRTVRKMIEDAVRRYIAALPDHDGHPFLSRKRRDFDFAGSWSVRLRSGGFHMDHLHPEGWISSCYYVGVPEAIEHGSGHQGWLRLGRSAIGLSRGEEPVRLVKPQVGKLLLFPSYLYHGTVPFEDERPRTTIAFDIVPR